VTHRSEQPDRAAEIAHDKRSAVDVERPQEAAEHIDMEASV
jgi:hypothetical protein